MKLLPFIVSSLCIIFFFDDIIFAQKKYSRVRCRDLWCSSKSRKDKTDLIKKANELRGYKEPEKPRIPWDVKLRYLYSKANKIKLDNRYGNDDKVKILRKCLVQFFEFLQNPKLLNSHNHRQLIAEQTKKINEQLSIIEKSSFKHSLQLDYIFHKILQIQLRLYLYIHKFFYKV